MRNVIRLHPWRHHDKRHAEARVREVSGQYLEWDVLSVRRLAIWRYQLDRRNMVIESTTFVKRQDEHGVRPCGASNKSVDHLRHGRRSHLDVIQGMFIRCGRIA